MYKRDDFFGLSFVADMANYFKSVGYSESLYLKIVLPIAKVPEQIVRDCWANAS